jgi:hypothetical protein
VSRRERIIDETCGKRMDCIVSFAVTMLGGSEALRRKCVAYGIKGNGEC